MRFHTILIVGLGLIVAGCSESEQAEPAAEAATDATATAAEATVPWEGDDSWETAGFMRHMHLHAERLDEINFALADGNLEAAKAPANWLATHDTYADVQQQWLPFLYAMRAEAEAVEAATDVATAQAAAERITVKCQECHTAVGIEMVEGTE